MAKTQGRTKDGKFTKKEEVVQEVAIDKEYNEIKKELKKDSSEKLIVDGGDYKIFQEGRVQRYVVYKATQQLLKELNAPKVIIDAHCSEASWARDSITGEQVDL